MLNSTTQEAKYEHAGRSYYLRPATIDQMILFHQFKATKLKVALDENRDVLELICDKPTMSGLMSIFLTDEQGNAVTVGEDEMGKMPAGLVGEMTQDFFLLHPLLMPILMVWLNDSQNSLTAIPNDTAGPASISGSTLSTSPQTETLLSDDQ